jgi:NhaA family Na+:H+ antiporter
MANPPRFYLSDTFARFFASEMAGGILLIGCTAITLLLANSAFSDQFLGMWQSRVGGMTLEHWVNDGLMAVFFLLIGLELERELYSGELSDFRNALLPIVGALGGIVAPSLIHFALNAGTPAQDGIGIPMATDIAFALGMLALLGSRIPPALKVFLVALAVMDDLAAIIVIALFYSGGISAAYLLGAMGVFGALLVLNRLRVMSLLPYLLGGAVMWYLMLRSGVHATIAGVLLAFAIPFSTRREDQRSPSHRLERWLHKPVAFVVLPLFAFANAGIVIGAGWTEDLASANSLGIIGGLAVGKPLGITLACLLAVALGFCRLPEGVRWSHLLGAGMLGGIGFTMSIFIANLAFPADPALINSSKMAILCASAASALLGYCWLLAAARNDTAR